MSLRRTGQEALLLWLQSRTEGYNGVNVVDFTRSWENGLAFCALIHSYYPDKIPFDTLKPENKADNLKLAFDTADKLGVPALMDPEDMLMDCGPDKFSVITYVSQYFHKWKNFDNKGSDEVTVKAPQPALSKEDEVAARRQKLDQERMLLKKCAKCQEGFPNGGTIIDALGKQYHPDCFTCFSCAKPFKDNKFVNVDANPYCPTCAKDKFTSKTIAPVEDDNPPCHKCKKICEGDTVNALGHSWHPDCFTCTTCNKLFQPGTAKVLNVDGFPYCEQCGRRAFVSRRTVTSPTPSQGLNKSKSMGSIPKMMEMAGDSPSAKPLLGGSNLSITGRLGAFQAQPKPEETAAKKEPGRLGSNSGIFTEREKKRKEDEERKKKEEDEKEARKKEDERLKEETRKKKEDEKLRKKQEEEDKKRKELEEKEARKKEEEEAKKRRAEETKRRKAEEEEKKRKEAEEEEARKREKTDQIRRTRSESNAKKLELEELKRKEVEDQKKKEAEEEERKKEVLRKKREEMKAKSEEEDKKKEEAGNKRSSIRFLQRSVTETFVAHNKIADVSTSSTTTILSATNTTPRGESSVSTPRETPATTVHTLITPRTMSPTPSSNSIAPSITVTTAPAQSTQASPSAQSFSLTPLSPGNISPAPAPVNSPTLGPVTTATEKVVKLQTPTNGKILCPASDVMCPWTSTGDGSLQTHVAACPFYQLRPILLKLKQSNEELQKKVEVLQTQQEKDHELIISLQQKLK